MRYGHASSDAARVFQQGSPCDLQHVGTIPNPKSNAVSTPPDRCPHCLRLPSIARPRPCAPCGRVCRRHRAGLGRPHPRSVGTAAVEPPDLEHFAEYLHAWIKEIGERFGHQPVGIAVESSKGAVVAALMEYPWLVPYPTHPSTSRCFSTAFTPTNFSAGKSTCRPQWLLKRRQMKRSEVGVASEERPSEAGPSSSRSNNIRCRCKLVRQSCFAGKHLLSG